jgi:hypothetical protein
LLWEYDIEDKSNGYLYVSENEEYLCLGLRKTANIVIFELANGEEQYRFKSNGLGWPNKGFISNDGSVIVWAFGDTDITHTRTKVIVDGETAATAIDIFIYGNLTTSIKADRERGRINYYMTPDGDYLIAGVPSCVKVFKIKK